jgi:hypothetical protein
MNMPTWLIELFQTCYREKDIKAIKTFNRLWMEARCYADHD